MRFGVPRSTSPSPVRRPRRTYSTQSRFGVPPDSSEDEFDDSTDSDSESIASSSTSSSDSFCYASESEVPPPPPKTKREGRSLEEQYYMEDTIASIRLRVRHKDPYEEWEHKTRKDALVIARHEQTRSAHERRQSQVQSHTQEASRRAALHNQQMAEVESQLASFKLAQQTEEQQLRAQWQERDRQLWDRIEKVIKFEQDKLNARLEAERKQREEEERKRKNEELKRRLEEEKRKQEAERLRKEEEERQKELQRQDEERKEREAAARQREERLKAEESERKKLGLTTAEDDWKRARTTLKALKSGPMKTVKANKPLKSLWSAARRQITPKVGQLTNDAQSINTISQQLVEIVRPNPPHPQEVYTALLSSLAKAILLQAETEVTAEKRSAGPLAQVAVNMLWTLEGFADIFWAKLCQRAGGWPVPAVVPPTDVDGSPLTGPTRSKALGYLSQDGQQEPQSEYLIRVGGIMRVYFHILFANTPRPLDPLFRLPRYWSYFARMLSEPALLLTSVAPEMLHTALEVGGPFAHEIWGHQWIKLLGILYEGATVGLNGDTSKLIGGTEPEGTAARVRVQLEIERLMSTIS
ncbi:hypothetical protein K474DRAFT_1669133 [Panus rudis PR-1116 ss-1]|nr:hypothetical protein K474DRAFT_1669133 [Panus rudis PR-1116 ss-1]